MKVFIEIADNAYKWINEHKGVTDFKTTEMLYNRIRNGIPLNGTNGEVLMKMFPNASVYEHGSTYSVNNVFNFNSTWWNAEYKGWNEMRRTSYGTFVNYEEWNENEIALNDIVKYANKVGIAINENTAISVTLCAEIMRRLDAYKEVEQ